MDKTAEYKLEKRSVNNKDLFNEIHGFIEEGILTGGVLWGNDIHRQSFVDIVGDCLQEAEDDEQIDQWNAYCDFRNNNIADMDKGIYIIEVTYRQKNCLNTTRLTYTIKDLLIANLKDLLDFQL